MSQIKKSRGIPCVNGGKNKKMMQAADAALAAAGIKPELVSKE